ncbi:MAG: hypothetical protein EOP82_30645 [Variovorax sp.]|nr:MAG: hypothetical protein EOP82_30645 [Variovorax sp.]
MNWRQAHRLDASRTLPVARDLVGLALLAAILVSLEDYRSDQLQDRRTSEQSRLLEAMESLHDPAVSDIVAHWRLAYPEPSEERLAELRDLAQQVQTDPSPLRASSAPAARPAGPAPGAARSTPAGFLSACAATEDF